MNIQVSEARLRRSKTHARRSRPPFDCIALLLQGGGALGAYQGGVYQGLTEADLHPDWVAGISIGAINSALIAGNPPERRVDQLRGFWDAELPVLEVVSTTHIVADLTLALGKVAYDYIATSGVGPVPEPRPFSEPLTLERVR